MGWGGVSTVHTVPGLVMAVGKHHQMQLIGASQFLEMSSGEFLCKEDTQTRNVRILCGS